MFVTSTDTSSPFPTILSNVSLTYTPRLDNISPSSRRASQRETSTTTDPSTTYHPLLTRSVSSSCIFGLHSSQDRTRPWFLFWSHRPYDPLPLPTLLCSDPSICLGKYIIIYNCLRNPIFCKSPRQCTH